MEQPTFGELEYESKKRKTRREIFLERMDGLIPWRQLEARIRPHYPKAGRGRRPYPLSVMLRIYCVQLFYNLSDPGMEDMLYEVESVRRFVGLRLSGALPDETTILNFRHLLASYTIENRPWLQEGMNKHCQAFLHGSDAYDIEEIGKPDIPGLSLPAQESRPCARHSSPVTRGCVSGTGVK